MAIEAMLSALAGVARKPVTVARTISNSVLVFILFFVVKKVGVELREAIGGWVIKSRDTRLVFEISKRAQFFAELGPQR